MPKSDNSNLPNHVGLILDGNRRWAKAHGLSLLKGHDKGYKNLRDVCQHFFRKYGIKYASAYIFSTENWNRTAEEVSYLMRLVHKALKEYIEEFHRDNIRLVVLGRRDKLKPAIIKAIEEAEAKTKNNTAGTLALCFNYGGLPEIVDAAKSLIKDGVKAEDVNEETFSQHIYHPEVPPVDLIIRTSGEQRLSGFMWWRAAYAELLFVDKHWPDFSPADADAALAEYAQRQRRFGK